MGKDLGAPPFDPANPIVITFSIVVSFIHTYLFMSVEENHTFVALGILKLEGGWRENLIVPVTGSA